MARRCLRSAEQQRLGVEPAGRRQRRGFRSLLAAPWMRRSASVHYVTAEHGVRTGVGPVVSPGIPTLLDRHQVILLQGGSAAALRTDARAGRWRGLLRARGAPPGPLEPEQSPDPHREPPAGGRDRLPRRPARDLHGRRARGRWGPRLRALLAQIITAARPSRPPLRHGPGDGVVPARPRPFPLQRTSRTSTAAAGARRVLRPLASRLLPESTPRRWWWCFPGCRGIPAGWS